MKYAVLYYILLSLLALCLYARDKRLAKRKKRRTPENVLLGVGLLGGAVGSLLGMNLFHHKTKHWYFWGINFLALVAHAALFWYLFF